MSAAAKISQGQSQERSSEDNLLLLHFDKASKATLSGQIEKTILSPFIEEAREESFDEIKENFCKGDLTLNYSSKSENYYGENIENKSQCSQRERFLSSNENDSFDGQSEFLTRWSKNQYNNGSGIIPALIQTSCINQEEVEFILHNLLQFFYNSPESSQTIDNTPTTTKEELKFFNPSQENLESLQAQMALKLKNGHGETRYIIGLINNSEDAGLDKNDMFHSLKNLCGIASSLEADVLILQMEDGTLGKIAHVLVRSNLKDNINPDIKLILLGDTKSGKSTLIGALSSRQLDDGNGLLRASLHNHKHEIVSGETSSLVTHMISIEDNGNMSSLRKTDEKGWENIVRSGAKVLTMFDIGGSEKNKHKIVSRLSTLHPDYALLVISAIQGVTETTEEHIRLALLFEIPLIVVITHADLVLENCLFDLRSKIETSIRKFSNDHYLLVAENEEDNLILSRTLKQKIAIPLFKISNVNGFNLSLFQNFLSLLPFNNVSSLNTNHPSEFHAFKTLHKEKQVILAGVVYKGNIKKHQLLLFGPDSEGNFRYAEVLNIRNKNIDVRQAYAGQLCTVELKVSKFAKNKIQSEKSTFKQGMILIDPKTKPEASMEFIAEIFAPEFESKEVVIDEGYEPVLVTNSTRQACTLDFAYFSEEIKNNEIQTENKENSRNQGNNSKIISLPMKEQNEVLLKGDKPLKLNQLSGKSQRGEKWAQKAIGKLNHANLQKKNIQEINKKQGKNSSQKQFCKRKLNKNCFAFIEKEEDNSKSLKIQSGESKHLKLRFKFRPEYLVEGQRIVIDDNCVKCFGIIRKVLHTSLRT